MESITTVQPHVTVNRSTTDLSSIYTVIVFTPVPLGLTPPEGRNVEKQYEHSGDHLFVAEHNAGDAVWIKLSSRRNPWIRVEQGDTITRAFSRFWVRGKIEGDEVSNFHQTVFYVSHGPLLDRPAQSFGLTRGFITFQFTIAGAARLKALLPAGFVGTQSVGRLGGQLILSNMDAANFLGISYNSDISFSQAAAFKIPPRTTMTFNLKASCFVGNNEIGTGVGEGIVLYGTDAAGASVACIMSGLLTPYDFDYTIPDTTNTGVFPFTLGE